MNITLNPELENLIQSQLKTGKYKTAEQVLGEALRLLEASNRREAISQKVKDLFEKTQKIPGVQEITEEEIAQEIVVFQPSSNEEQLRYNAWGKPITRESIEQTIAGMKQLRKQVAMDKDSLRSMKEEGRRF